MRWRTWPTGTRVHGGNSMEARTKSKTTSRDGTSSTEARRSKGTALADHAGKVDRDLGRLLSAMAGLATRIRQRSEEHTSELQSHSDLVCRLLLEKKKKK